MSKDYYSSFNKEYFTNRMGNDPKRVACFESEKELVNKYISSGVLLDVGCSTGEFLDVLQWNGPRYGMEVSEYATLVAKGKGIRFDRDLFNSTDFFDIIIFRGTIQHIDTPFLYMKRAFNALRPGGYLMFLMTPNTNSIYYKIWNSFPFSDPPTNFFMPSDQVLKNAMENFGFNFLEVRYPYIHGPYASPVSDHLKFIWKLFGGNVTFPFWGNIVDIVFQKPNV